MPEAEQPGEKSALLAKPPLPRARGGKKERAPPRAADNEPREIARKLEALSAKADDVKRREEAKSRALVFSFLAMVVVGLGNKVFQKLETIPMYNYPFFLNLLTSFVYIPLSFAYIIPMQMRGKISEEQTRIPKSKFAVMGVLDGLSSVMQSFSTNYITNASMIILLQQAAIPVSMCISSLFLQAKYTRWQITGAVVVCAGIGVVLFPAFSGGADGDVGHSQVLWAAVSIFACIPMCLSSVYKEKELGEVDIDVVYLNGHVAVYQFLVSLPLALPATMVMSMPLSEMPQNLMDGWRCFLGENSILEDQPHGVPADNCGSAPLFVSVYILFNLGYNMLMIAILKFGSANILWLAMTLMVPLGNVAFSLNFVPGHKPLKSTDISGLVIIMSGLILYRFAAKFYAMVVRHDYTFLEAPDEEDVQHRAVAYLGLNQLEAAGPVVDAVQYRAHVNLARSPLQIRSAYLARLGIPPSPHNPRVPRTPSPSSTPPRGGGSRGTSPTSAV